jgi:alkanesulfonate monooxygenase SsuD/methylene tetrahydromethanopterin reductase-like flavin-dependent oxidoreductase (luciferase family)
MRFQVLDILPHMQNPVTGRMVSPAERYAQALAAARRAEELGFDAVAVGERHAGPFLSSGVTVVLGAIAAATSRPAGAGHRQGQRGPAAAAVWRRARPAVGPARRKI